MVKVLHNVIPFNWKPKASLFTTLLTRQDNNVNVQSLLNPNMELPISPYENKSILSVSPAPVPVYSAPSPIPRLIPSSVTLPFVSLPLQLASS